jgi:hypothetical protein
MLDNKAHSVHCDASTAQQSAHHELVHIKRLQQLPPDARLLQINPSKQCRLLLGLGLLLWHLWGRDCLVNLLSALLLLASWLRILKALEQPARTDSQASVCGRERCSSCGIALELAGHGKRQLQPIAPASEQALRLRERVGFRRFSADVAAIHVVRHWRGGQVCVLAEPCGAAA